MKPAVMIGWIWCLAVVTAGAGSLRIATYNIENYGPANRVTTAGFRKDYPKPEAAKQALRTVLRGLNADILVLQEMGGPSYLEELRRDLAAEGLDYPHGYVLEAEDRDRCVAWLGKKEPLAITSHRELKFKYLGMMAAVKRGLLEVRLGTAAGEITLWALHLKSRYTEHADDPQSARRRAGEATAIRDFVLTRFPEPSHARFLMLGDFNDVKSSPAVRYMLKRGKTVVSELLPAADSRGESWTYAYRRDDVYQRVDHILVSPGLRAAVRSGRLEIYDGPGTQAASDHRPVVITLTFPPVTMRARPD